jgi:hypothetical protein
MPFDRVASIGVGPVRDYLAMRRVNSVDGHFTLWIAKKAVVVVDPGVSDPQNLTLAMQATIPNLSRWRTAILNGHRSREHVRKRGIVPTINRDDLWEFGNPADRVAHGV